MSSIRGGLIALLFILDSLQFIEGTSQCLTCDFLVNTFLQGLKITANKHFAGGDTAWEEKNLGRYATSETRLIEVVESVCKKSSLSNTDRFISVKDLEFKCAQMMEENEEIIEKWYYKHQSESMQDWLCVRSMALCCPKGFLIKDIQLTERGLNLLTIIDHYGKDCSPCPGLIGGAEACFSHGKCDGDGNRGGTGKCSCDRGYSGLLCRQCETNFYFIQKEETLVECAECYGGCSGGCTGPSSTQCNECRAGFHRNQTNACVDTDECLNDELKVCQKANEGCINEIGSFRCECQKGFVRNEKTNDCEIDIHATFSEEEKSEEDQINDEL